MVYVAAACSDVPLFLSWKFLPGGLSRGTLTQINPVRRVLWDPQTSWGTCLGLQRAPTFFFSSPRFAGLLNPNRVT